MKNENIIYKATVINNPTGKNNPILKFKLKDGTYIEKEYKYGSVNWGKGQQFNIKYNKNKIKTLNRNLHKLPFILYPVLIIIVVLYYILNGKIINFLILAILSIIPIMISIIIYYIQYKNDKKNTKKTNAKIIAFIPVFKSYFTEGYTYNIMQWRLLFEFQTDNGEIYRNIEDDKIFLEDRDVLTHYFELNKNIPIKYNTPKKLKAFIDTDNYKIEYRTFKGQICKAKIIQIETYNIDSKEKDNIELINCFKQEYLICKYIIENNTYIEKSQFPVNCGMFSIGEEITIRYNINNLREYNVSYSVLR